MVRWLLILVAVVANVTTNIALKKFSVSLSGSPMALLIVIFNRWLLLAVAAGLVLVGSYILAIRRIELEVAYAVVTTGSLVILAVGAPLIFGTGLSMVRLTGVALAVAGIAIIAFSQVASG